MPCDVDALRAVSAVALSAVAHLALLCRLEVEARAFRVSRPSAQALHTACNIALFPLLFFFSGLYYTDVVSTAVVLAAYLNNLRRVARDQTSLGSDVWTVVLGLAALLMRQTNVFWVVVYMGGLEAVHAIKTLRPEPARPPPAPTPWAQVKHLAARSAAGHVHDAPLNAAWPDGEPLAPPLSAPAKTAQTCSSPPSPLSSPP